MKGITLMLTTGPVLVKHTCEAANLICKHLVDKKNGILFLPTFQQTRRRHDYPLLSFDGDNMPVIMITNNPWSRSVQAVEETDHVEEENSPVEEETDPVEEENDPVEESSSQNVERNILMQAEHDAMEKRSELVAKYEEKFKLAMKLLKREMNNENFVKNFNTLAKPLITAVDECETALQARHQQSTWGSKKGKLAFWLQ